jgi:hypothetical protein
MRAIGIAFITLRLVQAVNDVASCQREEGRPVSAYWMSCFSWLSRILWIDEVIYEGQQESAGAMKDLPS